MARSTQSAQANIYLFPRDNLIPSAQEGTGISF